ncbi:MAG: hypothetical protein IKM76_11565 [Prevotella sp.]|nr:hypothetical protein [Prevotella sp.]MBR6828766.1 hypothetical protein [Prevotella sp.]
MELRLKRIARKATYTIGRLYIDGQRFCDTIEDRDRSLRQDMARAAIKRIKVPGETAIPTGRYRVTLGVRSPRMSQKKAYEFCDGYVPRLINVPGFDGILIHIGNTARDSEGCILVGENREVGKVLNSTATFKRLYAKLREAKGDIYITIE